MKKLALILLVAYSFTLTGCALLKRNRVKEHNGIEKGDFDLPIFLYPSKKFPTRKLVIFLSGDGGWIQFEDSLATKFAQNGFVTVGFNSRSYFWKQKTPAETAEDIGLIIKKYTLKYNSNKVYLCGYSFGADVIPFIYNRLTPDLKKKIVALQMLSPYSTTDFMVHFSDLVNIASDNRQYKVNEEVAKLTIPTFCFYGLEEDEKPLSNIKQKNFHISTLRGTHHYDDADLSKIINAIEAP